MERGTEARILTTGGGATVIFPPRLSVCPCTPEFFHSFTITTLVQIERPIAAECVRRCPWARFILRPPALLPRVSFFRADRR